MFTMGDGFDPNGVELQEHFEVTTCEPRNCSTGPNGLCGKMPQHGPDGRIKRKANGQMLLYDVEIPCENYIEDPEFPVLPICMANS